MSEWKHSSTDKAPEGHKVLVAEQGERWWCEAFAGAPTLLGQVFEFTVADYTYEQDSACWWFLPPPVPTNAP